MDLQQISSIQAKIDSYTESLLDMKEDLIDRNEVGNNQLVKYRMNAISLGLAIKENIPDSLVGTEETEMDVMKKIYMGKLLSIICDSCCITEDELNANCSNRAREMVIARQFHMALLHKTFKISQEKSGAVYFKHPATVVHSYKNIRNLYQTDKSFVHEYAAIFDHCLRYDELICSKRTQEYLAEKG